MVLSSHALAELGERAGRIIIMNQGKMVANGSIDHLRHLAHLPAKIRCKAADGNAEILSNKLRRPRSVGASTATRSKSTPCPSASSSFFSSSRTYL